MDKTSLQAPDSPLWHWAQAPGQAEPIPFGAITEDMFAPAMRAAMALQRAEIDAIVANPEAATFDNTIAAMERSGRALARVAAILEAWQCGRVTETLGVISEELAIEGSQHDDAITFNAVLFERVRAVHANPPPDLNAEDRRLLDEALRGFTQSGAGLPKATQERLASINARIGELCAAYGTRALAEREAAGVWFAEPGALDGLTAEEVEAAARSASENGRPGQYRVDIKNCTLHPFLARLTERDSRKRLFEASLGRSDASDPASAAAMVSEIARLRSERAGLLGKPSHAGVVLDDQMVHTPEVAMEAIRKMAGPVVAAAKRDFAELQALADAENDSAGRARFELMPWDLDYYDSKARYARAGFDAGELRRYMPLDKVLHEGVFANLAALYGVRFEPAEVEVMAEGATAYDVIDHDGTRLGLCYFDPYSRSDKQGGAWMMSLVQGTGLDRETSIIQVCMNLDKPVHGQAGLSMEDAITLFHEFGHAVHALFSKAYWPSLAGTQTATDFVELPSMAHERMVLDAQVFRNCLRDCPDPEGLHAKVLSSDKYHRGFEQLEYLSAAALDLAWHSLGDPGKVPAPGQQKAFEDSAVEAAGLGNAIMAPRYRSGYFTHAFGWDYDSRYYAYLWSNILANDAAAAFRERGGLTRENGDAFRKQILEMGNTRDPAELYRGWRGADADPKWLMHDMGLVDGQAPAERREHGRRRPG